MNIISSAARKPLNVYRAKKREKMIRQRYTDSVELGEQIRQKDKIKVLFILFSLPKWKTEPLYKMMLEHPRFDPVLGVGVSTVNYPSEVIKQITTLENYLKAKGYPFTEMYRTDDINEVIKPDIVFYQEAWGYGGLASSLWYERLKGCVSCFVLYAFEGAYIPIAANNPLENMSWKVFTTNELTAEYKKSVMSNGGENVVITGHPTSDALITPASPNDPWKKQDTAKKKIIWAPHHTIGIGNDVLHYGAFLEMADYMLDLAEKTKETVQWAFKPHPCLQRNLQYYWGQEKTEAYYKKWATMENTQLEEGEYIDLFKYSDAIVHESGSFRIEYLYMNKPCLYIDNGKDHAFNDFGKEAYKQYYIGKNRADVERFVQDVIDGNDPRKEERKEFYDKYLLPPNNRTACENIIAAILGEPPYDK